MTQELEKQIKHINNSLFAAKMENIIQYMYEEELKTSVAGIFHSMRTEILKNLEEYYGDVLFNAHMDLILAPIHEHHKQYYDTIMKYKLKEHRKGYVQGKRLVTRAKQYAKQYSKAYYGGAVKEDTINIPMSSIIEKDELFATSDYSAKQMRDKTFVASENTLARVDKDINGIITDGYRDGWGINDVTNKINTRFDQLETWEAQRIARTEIHGSHMQGVMKSYEDMGVEYTQWASAHDNRTRDTHSALDGEIIPFGGTFSNGLRYPGDTNGPISEWINCRCGCIPWFCPPGAMVPVGMTHFRESDLLPLGTLGTGGDLLKTSAIPRQSSSFDLDIVNPKLIDAKFSIPNEDLSEFGISNKGMETIQRYTKRRWGSEKEYGVVFNEKNGKFITKEIPGNSNDIVMTKPKSGKYSTIHYHTDEGFRPTSSGDFYEFLNSKNERVGINISRKESWFIKNEQKFTSEEINKITDDIAKLEEKQLEKLNKEYYQELNKIKKIKDPVKRESAQKEFEKYVANEFLDKHNKELGDAILEYTSNIKGLKVKRVIHTEINPKAIKTISKKELKVDKRSLDNGIKRYSNPIKNNEYDKYKLTETEEARLKELTIKKEKEGGLGFIDRNEFEDLADRKEFNEMWNKILREGGDPTDYFAISGAEGVRYEKLFKQFKNWEPLESIEIKPIEINKKQLFKDKNAFKLTSEEKNIYKQAKENTHALSDAEKEYYHALRDKIKINRLHKELIEDGLDEFDSKQYIKLYQEHIKEWNLPEISPKLKFSTHGFESSQKFKKEYTLVKDFKLTTKESNELYTLEKKHLINHDSLNSSQSTRMKYLQDKQEFNKLYSIKIQDKGLSYEEETKFKEHFAKLKYELNLHADLLDDQLPEYVLTIKPEPITSKTKLIKLKGTTENGLLPGNRNIEDYFTIDVSKCNPQERRVLNRWLSNDYAHFRDVIGRCDGDLDKFTDYVLKLDEERLNKYYHFVYNYIKEGNIELAKQEIRDIGLSIKHDYPILENIIENNQLKQAMTLWRTEERLHIEGKLEKGKIVTFKGNNSTAVTREGAEHFAEISQREFEWLYEIEAPAGTRGAYVSHMFDSNPKYAQEMEFLLAKDTKMEIVSFNEAKHYVKFRIIPEYEPKPINSSFTKYITRDGTKSINVREVDDPSEFLGYLIKAEDSVDPRAAWRVELPESVSRYDGCRMFVTEHGSTIAIGEDGDIISVCAYKNAKGESVDSTRALLEFATKNGGDRFDSFDGNYGVYRRCGFEPVSHIEFNEEYAPPGWVKGRDLEEHVIFFKYTGEEVHNAKKEEFLEKVNPITGKDAYDKAYAVRDKSIEKDLELKMR